MGALPLFDLSGRTALVTGSSGGLGFAMVGGLAEAGARLVLNGRDGTRLEAAAHDLARAGHLVSTMPFDVADETAIQAAFDRLDRDGIAVDILVNNAGIHFRKPMIELAGTDWRRVVDTNLIAAFLIGREAGRRKIPRGGGRIINIGSVMSEVARATTAPYTAAKGGIKMLTRSMAAEWAAHNIQANAIGPGYIETEMNRADRWFRLQCLGEEASAGRALGPPGRTDRHRRIPGLSRIELRQRPDDLRGRRHVGRPLNNAA